jgi:hypothetical protein
MKQMSTNPATLPATITTILDALLILPPHSSGEWLPGRIDTLHWYPFSGPEWLSFLTLCANPMALPGSVSALIHSSLPSILIQGVFLVGL